MDAMAFTGHRPDKLAGYDMKHPFYTVLQQEVQRVIDAAYHRAGIRTFISGGAIGVDLIAADLVLKLRTQYSDVRLCMAIPFVGQELRWKAPDQEHYRSVLEQADEVQVVCNGPYAGWKMMKRNAWMVDHSNIVLAVWDGSPGGTANCVKYAREKKEADAMDRPERSERQTETVGG